MKPRIFLGLAFAAIGLVAVLALARASFSRRRPGGAAIAVASAPVGGEIDGSLQRQKESFERIDGLETRQQAVFVQPAPPSMSQEAIPTPARRDALNLTIQADVLFAQGASALSAGGARKIAEVATVLRDYPESSIIVRGFTSSEGEDAMNVDLSQRRATAVANEIVANRIAPQRVQAQGMGESMPVADNNTELGRQRNRRVEILVIPYDEVR